MTHRSRGEGSIFFRKTKGTNGLWVGQISIPNGKTRTKYGKTQKEVKDWILTERDKLAKGNFIFDERMTVATFMDRYLQDYGTTALSDKTYESYETMIRNHIVPELGKIKLSKLRADHLNHLYSTKSNLSDRTVQYIHGILKRTLNKAVRWGLLTVNPTLMASPPTVKIKAPNIWSADQVKIFLESLKGHRWSALYYLACTTGMREGELLGLPVSALNLETRQLMIVQSLAWIAGKGMVIQAPKTDRSRRSIRIPEFVVDVLRVHILRRAELAKRPSWKESGLVFTTDIGTPIGCYNLLRHFHLQCERAELPRIRFHDLRHTAASLLLAKNVHPKIVQELLGHSTISLTLNTYSHIINPMNDVASDAMEELVG